MKKLLNTVYITTEGASLRKDGENLVAEVDGAERARVPFHMLSSLVLFGAIYISPALIGACAASGITIVLLDRAGRFQARVEGPVSGNVLLRRAQYRVSEAPAEIVRSLVIGKVANQRAVLMRALRDHGGDRRRPPCPHRPRRKKAPTPCAARRAANFLRLRPLNRDWRSRRPPLDPINALLSFLYTL